MSVDMTVEEIKECVVDTQLKIYYNKLCEHMKSVIKYNANYQWSKNGYIGLSKLLHGRTPFTLTRFEPPILTTGVTIHGKDISYFRKVVNNENMETN